MTASPPPNRWLAIALALASAGCLAAAALTSRWLVSGEVYDEIRVGLRAITTCGSSLGGAACTDTSNGELGGAFASAGLATFVTCLISAFGALVAAVLAIARKRPDLPLAPTTIALVACILALIAGFVFVATKPEAAAYLGLGPSFYAFAAGVLLGFVSAPMLAKVNRPPDPDLLDDAMNPDQF
ncbi:MAG TPA: hypothetical protein VMJ10_26830 [Kofleriaceae bacterium]|nr:hypothetical protein [Kofleriaceae bacterium]